MRVFLDANVLFSASNAGSNVAKLVELVLRDHTAVTSDFALEEARRNVAAKRPAWADEFATLAARVEVVSSVVFALPVELEEKDRPILCAAIRARCEILATGDRQHFGHLYEQTVEGVTVVTLLQLAERLV
jgi:predicted nucleic acid-binding protein